MPDEALAAAAAAASSTMRIKITSPSAGVPADLAFDVDPAITVDELKALIRPRLPDSPSNEHQRLIYRGKLLEGRLAISAAVQAGEIREAFYTLHLVVRPSSTPTAAPSTNPFAPPTNPPTASTNPFLSTSTTGSRPLTSFPAASSTTPTVAAAAAVNPGVPVTRTTTTSFQPNPHTRISTMTTRTTTTVTAQIGPPGTNPFATPAGVPVVGQSNRYANMSLGQIQDELGALRRQQQAFSVLQQRNNQSVGRATNSTGISLPAGVNQVGGPHSRNPFIMHINRGPPGHSREGLTSSPAAPAIPPGVSAGQPFTAAGDAVTSPTSAEAVQQNLDYVEAIRRGERPPEPIASQEASARRRALQAALHEMMEEEEGEEEEEEDDLLHSSLFSAGESPDSSATLYPFPATLTMPQISEGSQVYLLQDQLGRPSALLVGPRGASLPSVATNSLTRNNFGQVGIHNAHPNNIAVIGQHIPQNINPLLAGGQVPAGLGGPPNEEDIRQVLARVQQNLDDITNNVLQNQMRNRQMAIGDIPGFLWAQAGHLWLAAKLAAFVFLLSRNGGWQRTLYLGSIALVIFLWQAGLFNNILHFINETINPAPPPVQNAQTNAAQVPRQPAQDGAQVAAQLNPAQTAQMLIDRQQQGGMRQFVRSAERAAALFVASLIPGLHERHVHAVEQRNRDQRRQAEAAQEQQQVQQQDARGQQAEHQEQQQQPAAPAQPDAAAVGALAV